MQNQSVESRRSRGAQAGRPALRYRIVQLHPDWARSVRRYRELRAEFQRELAPAMHAELRIERIFRAGLDGPPAPDFFPVGAWKSAALYDDARRRRARRLLPELYRSVIRVPDPADLDRSVLAGLAAYAAVSGRSDWIYGLVAVLDANVSPREHAELYRLAALFAAWEGRGIAAEYYAGRVGGGNPYFDLCFEKMRGAPTPAQSGASASERSAAPPSAGEGGGVKRLLWLEAANDPIDGASTEQYLIRRTTKNPPFDPEELLDLAATLLARGRLFRAARLLLRHMRAFGESPGPLRLVLQLYLDNGKCYAYLRRLALAGVWPGPRAWYDAVYCLRALGEGRRENQWLERLLANKPPRSALPPGYAREAFREALARAGAGIAPDDDEEAPPRLELVEARYVLKSLSQIAEDPAGQELQDARLDERSRTLLNELRGRLARGEGVDFDRLGLYLHALLADVEGMRGDTVVARLAPWLFALGGRNLAARRWLAFAGLDDPSASPREVEAALLWLRASAGRHPLGRSLRAEEALAAGDHATALRLTRRLLRDFPADAVLHYNLGLAEEREGRLESALGRFRRALELDPDLRAARERLELHG